MNASLTEQTPPSIHAAPTTARAVTVAVVGAARAAVERAVATEPELCITYAGFDDADIVVVDAAAVAEARAHTFAGRVIAYAPVDDDASAARALRSGADGFLAIGDGPDEIVAALRTVVAGGVWLSPARLRRLLGDVATRPVNTSHHGSDAVPPLSALERDVLRLLANGATQASIA